MTEPVVPKSRLDVVRQEIADSEALERVALIAVEAGSKGSKSVLKKIQANLKKYREWERLLS
ncbi:hypothetical protein CH260_12735 [Rhodococcus sp. 05-2256-B2]|uniref:hypothetical protein n=1 Tax=unclassified Rhodococcus (in: high G+C Gram-positive bacteria) TaxID=192944 RepID=UPI000B9B816A|nr:MULTISPECIES: hypothetical protein [unclassified Rhodococcus (in: high G+C Gram-positive bacteria)]OZD82918.1 hypothetical protein CH258_18240 [Rhodococcus sp. 05-2256-B4]OZD96177.1 hypothetical protein CH260_12735 [Rhodococcus sp. 05-2256-B2]OZD96599.1 hypothetical protein CH257_04895 [Rhodococcus sp. 05-2256-B3]OZD99575.1 hypothetical protein CH285_20845 [Rhodococcus sp. 05-2256-B1]